MSKLPGRLHRNVHWRKWGEWSPRYERNEIDIRDKKQ